MPRNNRQYEKLSNQNIGCGGSYMRKIKIREGSFMDWALIIVGGVMPFVLVLAMMVILA